MKPRSFVLLLTLILAAFPLRAQWSGSADLATGLGGMTGNKDLDVARENRRLFVAGIQWTF